jgi:hypothetical protein
VTVAYFKVISHHFPEIRDSSVGIALVYGLDDRGSRIRLPTGAGNFSLHHRVQNGSGDHPASHPMRTRGFFLWIKRPGSEADHSPSWRGAQFKKKKAQRRRLVPFPITFQQTLKRIIGNLNESGRYFISVVVGIYISEIYASSCVGINLYVLLYSPRSLKTEKFEGKPLVKFFKKTSCWNTSVFTHYLFAPYC